MKYLISIILSCTVLFSEISNLGSGAAYIYGTNAREFSMGNTLSSVNNYGYNAFSNPALLTNVKDLEFGVSLFAMSLDRSIQTISIAQPLPPTATLALSFFRAGTNDIQGTDQTGNLTNTIDSWEGYTMLSFANKIGRLSMGFNLKVFSNQLTSKYSADGIGFDIGASFKIFEKSNIGISVKNISSTYNWIVDYGGSTNQYEENIESIFSVGYSRIADNYIIASQIDMQNNGYLTKIGMEYNILSEYKFRFGLNDDLYSIGFGIPFRLDNESVLNLDYALDLGLRNEGLSHLFTFTLLNY